MKPDTRQSYKRRPKPPPLPAVPDYPPGHFTGLVRAHNWPPRWEPQIPLRSAPDWSAISTANREIRQQRGETGTIVGLSKASDAAILLRRFRLPSASQ